MNTLQKFLLDSGLRRSEFCRKFGISYPTFFQHLTGSRRISPEMAIFYEKKLGIPRSELRPDLWPPIATPTNTTESGEDGSHA